MELVVNQTGLLAPEGMKWLNSVVLYTILAKEIFMIAGGLLMLKKGFVVHSSILGKLATAMFCAAIIMVFPGVAFEYARGGMRSANRVYRRGFHRGGPVRRCILPL